MGENPHPAPLFISPKMNISEMKLKIIICPATMLAKRRMINAAGLMIKTPATSTGIKMILTPSGTPGGQKICPQKCELVLNKITTSEITPSTAVKAVLPVTLADPGINPKRLFIKMKKKTVNK